jgi:hypothetical protein
MKGFMVADQRYGVYKFLKVKTFKMIIIFNSKINGQWPDLHDANIGILFDNAAEVDSISSWLMVIWSPMMNKSFKIKLEGSLKVNVDEDTECSIVELTKKIRKVFGLAINCTLKDKNGKEYPQEERVFHNRKDLCVARKISDKRLKGSKFKDAKIIIENGEATIYVDAKLFSIWIIEVIQFYLNMITGLKGRDFTIMINGIIWNDNMSIGSLKPQIIRATLNHYNVVHNVISIVNLEVLNIHAVNLKHNGCCINLTAPRNITLGQAFAMWCLLGINIPPFDYLQIDGRRVSEYEYNLESLDHWPWGKMFTLMNELKGGYDKEMMKEIGRKLGEYFMMIGFNSDNIPKGLLENLLVTCYGGIVRYNMENHISFGFVASLAREVMDDYIIMLQIEEKIEKVYDLNEVELFDMKKDLKFVNNLITLNYINEKDRSILWVTVGNRQCWYFGGRLSKSMSNFELAVFEENTKKQGIDKTLARILLYRLVVTGSYDEEERFLEFSETFVELETICQVVIEVFAA